eukprot:m.34228 g.34228  ORF g.34228 m.34228 type:complete len:83 (-) comp16950_c0_seq1:422-670(-)
MFSCFCCFCSDERQNEKHKASNTLEVVAVDLKEEEGERPATAVGRHGAVEVVLTMVVVDLQVVVVVPQKVVAVRIHRGKKSR